MPANQNSYWVVSIGATLLALNAREVGFIAPISDLNANTSRITISGRDFPVYFFDDDFQLIQCSPAYFRFCVCLIGQDGEIYSVAINSIRQEVFNENTPVYELPKIMVNPLFDKLVEINGEPILITSSNKIGNQISFQLKQSSITSTLLKVS